MTRMWKHCYPAAVDCLFCEKMADSADIFNLTQFDIIVV